MLIHQIDAPLMCSIDAMNNFFGTPTYLNIPELEALLDGRYIELTDGVVSIYGKTVLK